MKASSYTHEGLTVSPGARGDLRPTPQTTIELLREILEELRGLRAGLQRGSRPEYSDRSAGILLVLEVSVADRAFSAREVVQHAALVDGPLRGALDAAGLDNPRKLGKWLRTNEGRTIAGVRLERLGVDRDGIVWRVWRVSNSHTHTPPCGDDDRGA